MQTAFKRAVIFLSYIIRRFFINRSSDIKTTLQTQKQTVAVPDEKLHYYIRRKIITKKETKIFALVLASLFIN